jgi:hypothetical protein
MAELNGKKVLFSPHIHLTDAEYEAGTGIEIANSVISLDAETQAEIAKIADKQDKLETYILQWDDDPDVYEDDNVVIMRTVVRRKTLFKDYYLLLKVGDKYLTALTVEKTTFPKVTAIDMSDLTAIKIYTISALGPDGYQQTLTTIPLTQS